MADPLDPADPPERRPLGMVGKQLPEFEDDAVAKASLRAQGAADPPRGAPMRIPIPGEPGEFHVIEPGRWRETGHADRLTGLPVNCPIIPLGKRGDQFFFLNTLGEIHVLAANAGKGHIDALFAGRPGVLTWAWPRWAMPKTKSEGAIVTNWQAEDARQDLFSACAYKGVFEAEDRVRGRGAWPGLAGDLIYHAGDAVWIEGVWRGPGEYDGYIYPGRPAIGRPALPFEPAGEGSPGDVLLQALMSWTWERGETDALLALGWLVTAMVGGALEQRPVGYIVGSEGVGKSTLQRLMRWLMNGALVSTSNSTQAGIYHKVKQDSIAVLVDENEPKEDTRATDRLMELARIAFSGDKLTRGSKDNESHEFAVMSSFLFSSVALPALDSQDASRIAVLMMRDRPQTGRDVLDELGLYEPERVRRLGSALLRRVFEWFKIEHGRTRWAAVRDAMREALIAAGHEDRSADVFGALAAGAHIALRDEMPDAAELAQWAAILGVDVLAETAGRQKTWQRCFFYMIDAAPEVLRTWTLKSVGAALEAFRRQPANAIDDLEKVLKACGLGLRFPRGAARTFDQARLFVPSTSPALHAVFEGTVWAGRLGQPGPWGGVLRQMPRDLWRDDTLRLQMSGQAWGISIDLAAVLADLERRRRASVDDVLENSISEF